MPWLFIFLNVETQGSELPVSTKADTKFKHNNQSTSSLFSRNLVSLVSISISPVQDDISDSPEPGMVDY